MIDEKKAHAAVKALLRFIGDDPDRDGLKETPKRVIKSFSELYGGYAMDPRRILSTQFEMENQAAGIILSKDIPFTSTCEHHMLPFVGRAHVAYIPQAGGKIVGLSKLARVVDCFSRRLQNQERITHQVARSIYETLNAQGVGVVIQSEHSCMSCRGVKKSGSTMVTSVMLGAFRTSDQVRAELYLMIGSSL